MSRRLLQSLANPVTAAVVSAVSLIFLVAVIPLEVLVPGTAPDGSTAVAVVAWFLFGASFTAVGFVVARTEPRNPLGWLLIVMALAIDVGSAAPAYAYLDYGTHHESLPLGALAVLLSGDWIFGFLALPLVILLFPDARVGRRWRAVIAVYLAIVATLAAGLANVAIDDLSLRVPVDAGGNLVGLSNPRGWFGVVFRLGFVSCIAMSVAAIVRQAKAYRHAGGERRQQLKWLSSAGAICIACTGVSLFWSHAPAIVGDAVFPIGLAVLPLSIGVAILRFRLYDIDRIISRTLSWAILTALLAGTFVGIVALATDVLPLSGRVGVAASTLAAAGLFNPLRRRIQRRVDRRFNRARYDAEETVAAFSARLRDAVELDVIRHDLLEAVNRAVQPANASVWLRR